MSDDKKESNLKWLIDKILIPVIVALIGAYAVLAAAKILPFPLVTSPTSTPTPIASPVPQLLPFPSDMAGKWFGLGDVVVNNEPYYSDITLTLSTPCEAGNICGQVSIPTITCSFTLTFLNLNDAKFYFQQGNFSGNCGIAATMYLQPLQNGTMLFHSEGNLVVKDIVLTSQK